MMKSDYILQAYILQDLRERNFNSYTLKDEMLVAPTQIEVSNNEVVYLAYYQTRQPGNFKTTFHSGMEKTEYDQENTPVSIHVDGAGHYYTSGIISRHDTNVEVTHTGAPKFLVRVIRLTLFDKNEKG